MNEILDRELVLIAKARLLIPWIEQHFLFSFDELFADAAMMAKLNVAQDKALFARIRPFPKQVFPKDTAQMFTTDAALTALFGPPASAMGLWPVLDLLHHYGVILLPPNQKDPFAAPSVLASLSRVEATIERGRFDTETAAIEAFALQFKQRVVGRKPVAETGQVTTDWSASTKPEETYYRAFAQPVLMLLGRLRSRNQAWKVGTYPNHWWNEFSADMFLSVGTQKDGFYNRDGARAFFEALNAACEDDTPPGTFAWKAIYNDEPLAEEMNQRFGAGRVLFGVPGHGPGSTMHIHLDLRPLDVPLNATGGFFQDGNRVVLTPPPLRPTALTQPPLPAPIAP
jgi:hypothetical protein